MTERGDPKAIFQPTYGCNPDTDAVQVELSFVTWQNHSPGQWICVRPTYDNAYEFRYYPPGDTGRFITLTYVTRRQGTEIPSY